MFVRKTFLFTALYAIAITVMGGANLQAGEDNRTLLALEAPEVKGLRTEMRAL